MDPRDRHTRSRDAVSSYRSVIVTTTPMVTICLLLLLGAGLSASESESSHEGVAQVDAGRSPGRSVVRARSGMVASSQPLASQVGLRILQRGGNAVDAAIAMAGVLNVTEPMMTGIGGDMFALLYWAETGEVKGLNASGRAPRALTPDTFARRGVKEMPETGMGSITVPGAFDGWVVLLKQYGTMSLTDLLSPAIEYADHGFPVMEKTAKDWEHGVDKLKHDPVAAANYLVRGRAPRAGEVFRQPNLAETFRRLARGGREAFYRGEIARAIVDYCRKADGFLSLRDLAEHESEWIEPIQTTYRGYTVYQIPPNSQGLTSLLALNILEEFDLGSLWEKRDLYYHTILEAIKLAFVDRDRYIADPAFAEVPVAQLLSKEYATQRRQLIQPNSAIDPLTVETAVKRGDTTYFTVIDRHRNAVSFINSLAGLFGSGMVAGETGIVLQNRGAGFSLDPEHPNRLEPGKRPFHTLVPAMVLKDGELFLSFGVIGGLMQPQAQVQILVNLIDLGMGLQQAIEAPRCIYWGGRDVLLDEMTGEVAEGLSKRGHHRVVIPELAGFTGGAQAVMIDPVHGTLMGASDSRRDGLALGY